MISTPTPPVPPPPPPPPNPPQFPGQVNAAGARFGAQVNPSRGFGGTILGTGNPNNTGQKTLLGQ